MGASSPRKLEYNRARYAEKKEAILAQQREYYLANKPAIRARHRAYVERNAERLAAYNRSELGRARSRRYDEKHRDERRLQAAARRASNPGYAYAATKRYIKRFPEVKSHWDSVRQARERGATGRHTLAEWRAKKEQYGNLCAYCGCSGRLVKDHDIPLARGGTDFIENIVPACHRCNSQKRALTGAEYRERFHASRA